MRGDLGRAEGAAGVVLRLNSEAKRERFGVGDATMGSGTLSCSLDATLELSGELPCALPPLLTLVLSCPCPAAAAAATAAVGIPPPFAPQISVGSITHRSIISSPRLRNFAILASVPASRMEFVMTLCALRLYSGTMIRRLLLELAKLADDPTLLDVLYSDALSALRVLLVLLRRRSLSSSAVDAADES